MPVICACGNVDCLFVNVFSAWFVANGDSNEDIAVLVARFQSGKGNGKSLESADEGMNR